MYFKEVKLDFNELLNLLENDSAGLMEYMDRLIARKFYIGDTGINRKTLKDWENNGLLPYEYLEEGWRKFSFIEWVWLECILEFRQLGVSLEKIREIKKQLFDIDPEEVFLYFKQQTEGYKGKIDNKENAIAGYNQPDLTPEMKQQWVQNLQLSPFFIYVVFLLSKEPNLCIAYNNSNFCSFFIMGGVDKSIKKANDTAVTNLVKDSFVVLNLKKVLTKIFQKPELRHNDNFILDFLSPTEKKILDQIRDTNAKEITLTFDRENNPTHIKVNRNQISKETLNKVARYLKKGNYQTIEFTTRDGQLIKYEETDTIKLDK